MAKAGSGHMPHIASNLIDERGLNLIAAWIASLPAAESAAPSDKTVAAQTEQDAALKSLQMTPSGDLAMFAIDKLLTSTEGALKLVLALSDGRLNLGLRTLATQRAMASSQDTIRDLFVRFTGKPIGAGITIGANPDTKKLLAMPGDAERGRKVFVELAGGLCSKCHIVDGQGTDFGPDLTKIGAKYNRADMLDNILHPSKTIVPGYETWLIRTKSRDTLMGFIVSKSETEVVLKDQERKIVKLKTEEIDKMVAQPISAMPEGAISDLEPQQAADLLEFLVTRK
jgi:putative heme-binding domain-containing protein